mmetsp:Transcript_3889/g.8936  ORF Transcript_3889/g.8936 Transcript_3889/m.8936 type:complete len:204 (-) Transcript_3889:174-785(-)
MVVVAVVVKVGPGSTGRASAGMSTGTAPANAGGATGRRVVTVVRVVAVRVVIVDEVGGSSWPSLAAQSCMWPDTARAPLGNFSSSRASSPCLSASESIFSENSRASSRGTGTMPETMVYGACGSSPGALLVLHAGEALGHQILSTSSVPGPMLTVPGFPSMSCTLWGGTPVLSAMEWASGASRKTCWLAPIMSESRPLMITAK